MSSELTTKERKRSLFSVFSVASLDNFGFGLVFILFAPLILNSSYGMLDPNTSVGMRNVILGVLFAVFPLTQFLGAPLLGDFADRFGRKKALYLTIIGTTIGYILSGIAIEGHSVGLLIFSRLWTGFFAGNLSICLAAIADFSPDEKTRGKNYGLVTVVWGVSWPIAMIVGGYLSDPTLSPLFRPSLPFFITAVLSVLSYLVIHYYFTETHPGIKGVKFDLGKSFSNINLALKVKQMRPYFLVLLFWTIGWGFSVQWFGAYSIELYKVSQEKVSWALICQGLFWVVGGSFLNPFLLRRFSSWVVALIGIAFAALFIFASTTISGFWNFSLVYWIAAIGASFGMSNTLNLVSLSASEEMQGRAMGLSQSMMSLAWFIVPLLGSVLGDLDIHLFYVIAGIILLIAIGILYFHKPEIKKEQSSDTLMH